MARQPEPALAVRVDRHDVLARQSVLDPVVPDRLAVVSPRAVLDGAEPDVPVVVLSHREDPMQRGRAVDHVPGQRTRPVAVGTHPAKAQHLSEWGRGEPIVQDDPDPMVADPEPPLAVLEHAADMEPTAAPVQAQGLLVEDGEGRAVESIRPRPPRAFGCPDRPVLLEPDHAVPILVDRADLVVAQAVGHREAGDALAVEAGNAFVPAPEPGIASAIFEDGAHGLEAEPGRDTKDGGLGFRCTRARERSDENQARDRRRAQAPRAGSPRHARRTEPRHARPAVRSTHDAACAGRRSGHDSRRREAVLVDVGRLLLEQDGSQVRREPGASASRGNSWSSMAVSDAPLTTAAPRPRRAHGTRPCAVSSGARPGRCGARGSARRRDAVRARRRAPRSRRPSRGGG